MLSEKQKKDMREYEQKRRAELKKMRSGYSGMTRDEKIAEAKRLREQVRKRVERLKPLEDDYGSIPALEAIEKNRKGYSMFDVDRRKIAVKNEKGKTIPINKLTDEQLDELMTQATKWLTAKTSQVSGAKDSVLKRTRNTMETLSKMMSAPILDDFQEHKSDDKYVMKVAKEMSKFWKTISELRKTADPSVVDKILKPDEYSEVFEEVMDLLLQEQHKAKTPKELAALLSSILTQKADELTRERKAEAERLVRESGGMLSEDLTRMRGGFRGNKKKKK